MSPTFTLGSKKRPCRLNGNAPFGRKTLGRQTFVRHTYKETFQQIVSWQNAILMALSLT